jgi:HPt (histidine-containing phosphotransfer) domain-containing protein
MSKADLDLSPLLRLLALLGPKDGAALLDQLQADLATAQKGLAAALTADDAAALYHHAHVLTALAGTIGATDLGRTATTLQDLAAAGSCGADAQHLGQEIEHLLDPLCATLRTLSTPSARAAAS